MALNTLNEKIEGVLAKRAQDILADATSTAKQKKLARMLVENSGRFAPHLYWTLREAGLDDSSTVAQVRTAVAAAVQNLIAGGFGE
jgi:hypothetical protein